MPSKTKRPNYKTSLRHVPVRIQDQLSIVLELILQNIKTEQVAMVWLFGSYARGDAINDCHVNPKTGQISEYYSDVDVLVVAQGKHTMQHEKLWRHLDQGIENHPDISSNIHIVRDSITRVGDALKHSEYFYLDVLKEGIVLYGKDIVLPKPQELSIEERRSYSIDYLNQFYPRVNASKQGLELYYQLGDFGSAMYCLHQMSERLFYTYLLVFTHYKPRSHKLTEFRERVATINTEITHIFPLKDEGEKGRFVFLNDAYVDSRYKDNYEVDPVVLDYLIGRVAEFQRWVLGESLKTIDGLIPENNFSNEYSQPGEFLDLKEVKAKQVPHAVIQEQLEALKIAEAERDDALAREEEERKEKERLLKKLRDAGLEP